MANDDRDGEAGGERVARLYGVLRPHLDERQRRLLLGAQRGVWQRLQRWDWWRVEQAF